MKPPHFIQLLFQRLNNYSRIESRSPIQIEELCGHIAIMELYTKAKRF